MELRRTVGLAAYAVGFDSPAEEPMRLVNVESNRIQVLGSHGMGVIGKTTIAKGSLQ